jgi:PAP2 superfamily
MLKIISYIFLLNFILTQFVFGQKPVDKYDSKVVESWYELQLTMIPKTAGFAPPVVARALGYTGLTLYEAIVPGMKNYSSLEGKVQGLKNVPKIKEGDQLYWPAVANAALMSVHSKFYGQDNKENKALIEDLFEFNDGALSHKTDPATLKKSNAFGISVAEHIYKYSKTDGGHQAEKNLFPKEYKAPPKSCAWVGVGEQKALLPFWGNNRTFLPEIANHSLPEPPKCDVGNSSILYVQALEVYSIGKNLTDDQKAIADFWADDAGKTFTPPGHGASIALQLARNENLNLEKSTELFCRLGIASNDAFVSCWKCKYQYFLMRPTSFIHSAIDDKFKSYLSNPPFPEYTSGHGTVSGAIAAVLSDMFGYNYAFTDHSHTARGLAPRSFDSFQDFAREAALSRLYGGIHYRMSNDEGLKNGMRIGKKACELKLKMKAG